MPKRNSHAPSLRKTSNVANRWIVPNQIVPRHVARDGTIVPSAMRNWRLDGLHPEVWLQIRKYNVSLMALARAPSSIRAENVQSGWMESTKDIDWMKG